MNEHTNDPMAEHAAVREIQNNLDILPGSYPAEQVASVFTWSYETRTNEHGIKVRRLVARQREESVVPVTARQWEPFRTGDLP